MNSYKSWLKHRACQTKVQNAYQAMHQDPPIFWNQGQYMAWKEEEKKKEKRFTLLKKN